MANIQPNSTIWIVRGCNIDKNYTHTLYFPSAQEQSNYFSQMVKFVLNDYSYIRHTENSIKVNRKADDLFDCNYMVFTNTNFSEKKFYAFIDSVEYVSNDVCVVNYTIDVMQTWYFDYELGNCFVEREHVLSDEYGEHLIGEPIKPNNVICFSEQDDYIFGATKNNIDWYVCIRYIRDASPAFSEQGMTGVPLAYETYSKRLINKGVHIGQDVIDEINAFINDTIGGRGNIVEILFLPCNHSATEYDIGVQRTWEKTASISRSNYVSYKGESYNVKNLKCLTYPFYFAQVTNNNGGLNTYRYEFSSNNSVNFTIDFTSEGEPVTQITPLYYKGIHRNYDESMLIQNYPKIAWSLDTFKEFYAQNMAGINSSFVSSAVGGVTSAVGGFLAGGVVGGVIGGVSAVTNIINNVASVIDQYNKPNKFVGSTATNLLDVYLNKYKFTYRKMSCTPEEMKMVDNFFDMYGYQINRLKVPNIKDTSEKTKIINGVEYRLSLRPHWNYIKTNGCIIHHPPAYTGRGIPADVEDTIAKIYDRGITFWTNGDNVGDYTLDNSPVLTPTGRSIPTEMEETNE